LILTKGFRHSLDFGNRLLRKPRHFSNGDAVHLTSISMKHSIKVGASRIVNSVPKVKTASVEPRSSWTSWSCGREKARRSSGLRVFSFRPWWLVMAQLQRKARLRRNQM
jgi:hypothetical protein